MEMQREFIEVIHEYYRHHGRHDLPWRLAEPDGVFDPYKILVSEIMLQQTQVPRVIPKFLDFLQRFPTVWTLADAPLGDVLVAWQGLGYNRRAKFLWQAARQVVNVYSGAIPNDQKSLEALPGIGANTAAAIRAYAFNEATVFVETNIRTVFIHHFFKDEIGVTDHAILELVSATLDRQHPREWYWALMDYGTNIKQTIGNKSRASRAYAKQTAFNGSLRQIRGMILKLLATGAQSAADVERVISDERTKHVLATLETEGLIQNDRGTYRLP